MRVKAPLNPNLWHVPKVELKGRCIALFAYRDGEKPVTNDFGIFIREIGKKLNLW